VVIGRDDDEVHYQIAIWHPSYGNQENAKIIHEYPHGNGDSTFLNLLISTINDTEYTPY